MRLMMVVVSMLAVMFGAADADPVGPIPFPGVAPELLPPRLALVVGVQRYRDAGSVQLNNLDDTAQDVQAMANLFKSIGFETTVVTGDADHPLVEKVDILRALTDFVNSATAARQQRGRNPILLFYFAGHGFNLDGKNFLLPSNFYADDVEDVDGSAFNVLTDIVTKLAAAEPALQIIITDSCRSPAPPQLRRRGTSLIVKATTNGVYEPNKSRTPPPREEYGKNRTTFLFSTQDQHAAFGGGAGGRFTQALYDAFVESLSAAQQDSHPTRSLNDIFISVRNKMADPAEKWQRPFIDENYGAPFYPLPTQYDFTLEQTSFVASQKVEAADFNTVRDRRICNMQNMLEAYSEFSYFSWKIIQEIDSRPPYLGKLDCKKLLSLGGGTNGIAVPPSRRLDGRLDVQGITGPANIPSGPSIGPQTPRSPPSSSPDPVAPAGQPSQRLWLPTRALSRLADSSLIKSPIAPRMRLAQAVLPAKRPKLSDDVKPGDSAKPAAEPTPGSDAKPTTDSKPNVEAKPQVEAKPTFGDVEQATQTIRGAASSDLQLDPTVPLDKAVVAKQNVFLRSAPTSAAPVVSVIPAGQLLEVIGTSENRAWIQVRHNKYGTGFVSGDYIEAALVKLSKAVSFDARAFELSERAKAELAASFGALGGVLVVDAAIDYPDSEAAIGFARATQASQFIQNLAVPSGASSTISPLYISLRPVARDKIESNTVRATILGLPLDQNTRVALAQVSRSGQPILLDLNVPMIERAGADAALPDLKFCNATGGGDCNVSARDTGSANTVLETIRDITKDTQILSTPVTGTVKRLQGLIKF